MKSEKRIYCAPSMQAHGSLRTLTADPGKTKPPKFDSPVTNDLPNPFPTAMLLAP